MELFALLTSDHKPTAKLLTAILFWLSLLAGLPCAAQPADAVSTSAVNPATMLAAGPMPGYSTAQEAAVWVQTREAASVQLLYWPEGREQQTSRSASVQTRPDRANTATLTASNLQPGTRYHYRIVVNGELLPATHSQHFNSQSLLHEGLADFSFALGSCAKVNAPPYDASNYCNGGDYQIFDAIAEQQPDFMLWLGDNAYYLPPDTSSASGMYGRYSQVRQLPELQRLLSSTHHYAIWDDHDYGPNNSDRSFGLRDISKQVFHSFWANPVRDAAGSGGISSTFEWQDAAFFLLDNRSHRRANLRVTGQRQILGPQQLDWLINALSNSLATFKFIVIGGQVLNSGEVFENHINIAPGERRELLDRIAAERIPGVVILSGDRHHSAMHIMPRYEQYPLHEWTVSPLTAKAYSPVRGEGQYIVDDSIYTERNFGVIRISGPAERRRLQMILHDANGREVWSTRIDAEELQ